MTWPSWGWGRSSGHGSRPGLKIKPEQNSNLQVSNTNTACAPSLLAKHPQGNPFVDEVSLASCEQTFTKKSDAQFILINMFKVYWDISTWQSIWNCCKTAKEKIVPLLLEQWLFASLQKIKSLKIHPSIEYVFFIMAFYHVQWIYLKCINLSRKRCAKKVLYLEMYLQLVQYVQIISSSILWN